MTANSRAKTRSLLVTLLWAAGFITIIAAASSKRPWLIFIAAAFCFAPWLASFIQDRNKEPYFVARNLFWLALLCSWELIMSAKDPILKRGAWVTGTVALLGIAIAWEMKMRILRKNRTELGGGAVR